MAVLQLLTKMISFLRNGFDLILEKACYDFSIDKRVIAELSCGGLFKKIIRKN